MPHRVCVKLHFCFSSYPSPIVATEPPSRRHNNQSPPQQHYTIDSRARSRSSSRSPARLQDRARSFERNSNAYSAAPTRSLSYDRAVSSRSCDNSLGYGSFTGSYDVNARSIPDSTSGQRYRSTLLDLGPTPGETREERRRRMRELLRTLDKTSPRVMPH